MASLRSAITETLESRTLLSTYTLTTVASLGTSQNGSQPAGITVDSSGNIYGFTVAGGANGGGTFYEIAAGTTTITPLVSFSKGQLSLVSAPVFDANGNVFAAASSTSAEVIEIAKGSSVVTTVASVPGNINPGLYLDSNDDIFGTDTNSTSTSVFEIPQGSATATTLATFNTTSTVSLAVDGAGNVYGTTPAGGDNNDGSVFEIAQATPGTVTPLASFDSTDGADPVALIRGSDGTLYGITVDGGAHGVGDIFKIAAGTATITDIADFNNSVSYTAGVLSLDTGGNLFGTTFRAGDGVQEVFEVASGTSGFAMTVSGTVQENVFDASVAFDSNGDVYGSNGAVNSNDVYELPRGATSFTTVAVFDPASGSQPDSLVRDSSGNLFGATLNGGTYGFGTLFEVPAGAANPVVITNFNGNIAQSEDAGWSPGDLGIDASGNLFGTVTYPIDQFDPENGTIGQVFRAEEQHDYFTYVQGSATPTAPADLTNISVDPAGDVFGTDYVPSSNTGTVFEMPFSPTSPTVTLATFSAQPTALAIDANDNVFGVYQQGNTSTLFEIAQGATAATTLASFTGPQAAGVLVADANDDLFGINENGVYELAAGASTITPLAPFNAPSPSNLLLDSSGDLFWTAGGESAPPGAVYELAQGASTVSVIYTFGESNNSPYIPSSPLVMDGSGNLFGVTSSGGAANVGAVYELTPGPVAPSITTQPASQAVNAGQTVTLIAAATGTPAPTVQWQISTDGGGSFTNIAGATSATYSFTASTDQNGDEYQAVFTNSQGSATTSPATLTVNAVSTPAAPTVTSDPVSESVFAGNTVIFTAAANGYPTPTVQWQLSTNNGTTFSDISGATSATYSFTALARQDGYEYRAVFVNSDGSATTAAATLSIVSSVSSSAGPVITTNPVSQTVGNGGTVSFSAAASGNPTPTVQWQVSLNGGITFSSVPGATSTTYSFTASTNQSGYQYRAVFTNSQSSATTSAATLTVSSTASPSQFVPSFGRVRLPASLVAGARLDAIVPLALTNTGSNYNGKVTLNFYLDTTPGLDGNQILLKSLPARVLLRSGRRDSVTFGISKILSPSLAAGSYYLVAEVIDSSGKTNLVATPQTVKIAAPFVQPVVSVGAVKPSSIALNRFGTLLVTVSNTGNVAATGITLTLGLSADGITPVAGVVLDSVTHRALRIAPGRKVIFQLRFRVTTSLPTGTYVPYVSVILNGIAATRFGTTPFTIA